MTDDELFSHLASAVRRRPGITAPTSPALERVAQGDAREETLDAVAAEDGYDRGTTRKELRPLGEEFEKQLVASIVAAKEKRPVAAPLLRLVEGASAAKKRRVWNLVIGATTGLALAASAVLWVSSKKNVDALPGYSLSTDGADKEVRGAAIPDVVRVGRDSTLSLLMRPSREVVGNLEAQAAIVRDGTARLWTSPLDVAPNGVVRLRANVPTLFPEGPGGFDVVIVVGRIGTLPGDAGGLAKAHDDAPPGVRVGRVHVEVVGER